MSAGTAGIWLRFHTKELARWKEDVLGELPRTHPGGADPAGLLGECHPQASLSHSSRLDRSSNVPARRRIVGPVSHDDITPHSS